MASAAHNASSLLEFIRSRRWFRSKARNVEKAEIEDVIAIPNSPARVLLVRIEYAEGDCDHYLVTDSGSNSGEPREALDNPELREQLVRAFQENASWSGESGELTFSRTKAFRDEIASRNYESFVSRAEQSNTSIVYGDWCILKLFRKIEPGINPDIEVGAFLTEGGFKHTPAVQGTLEYRSKKGDIYSAGILQQFVPNRGDAWKYTLESLHAVLDRVSAPGFEQSMERFDEIAADYIRSAALLGQRTAEMHIALANAGGNPDFEPEPFTAEARQKVYEEMLAQADIAFETLRRRQATLSGDAADFARTVLRLEYRVADRFAALREHEISAYRIRIHGDYHLGQVLWTASDFMIIDFEGEPARPLNERRTKSLAMRDVAGMLRSFEYAHKAALLERSSKNDDPDNLAGGWNSSRINDAYLDAYVRAARGNIFLPVNAEQRRMVLDAFLLQKALYELAYEMNNRPDWVAIPLRGILTLIA
ncbi:MAG TPA: putative maltokinase [Bryobacteraceae bacterium]|nr:putative maltokinase [Bryobacteraceae bacterium]